MAHVEPDADAQLCELPEDLVALVVSRLCLRDQAACRQTSRLLWSAVEASLQCATRISCSQRRSLHTVNVDQFLRFIARCCGQLQRLHVCFLPFYTVDNSHRLCTAWSVFAPVCRVMSHLSLLNVHITDDNLLEVALNAPLLQCLAVGCLNSSPFHSDAGDEGLQAVALHCPQLHSLALFQCQVSDVGLAAFHRCGRHFRSLTLHNCKQVSRLGLMAVAESCANLERLDVLVAETTAPQLDFAAMFVLAANCTELQELQISEEALQVAVLDDPAIGLVVEGCPHLRSLDLVQVEVGDVVLSRLAAACTGLVRLRLEQTYVGDRGIAAVAQHCPLLQELRVLGCSQHVWVLPNELLYPGATEAGLLHVTSTARHLTSLEVAGLLEGPTVREGDRVLGEGCVRLRHLALDWMKLQRPCLDAQLALTLAACPALTSLSLKGYQGDIDSLLRELVPSCGRRLEALNLQHTCITDEGLAVLAAHYPHLHTVLLGHCRGVTDVGLAALEALVELQQLDLYAVPAVSDDAVVRVAAACKALQEVNVGQHHGAQCAMSIEGYRALHNLSRHRNTALNIAFDRPSAASRFQAHTLGRLQRLCGSCQQHAGGGSGGGLRDEDL